jgi:hypothetical protein
LHGFCSVFPFTGTGRGKELRQKKSSGTGIRTPV